MKTITSNLDSTVLPCWSLAIIKSPVSVVDQGFSPGGSPTSKLGLFWNFFAENCMKMKEFAPPGDCASLAPPICLDPPMGVLHSLDTGNLTIAVVQNWIWDNYLNLTLSGSTSWTNWWNGDRRNCLLLFRPLQWHWTQITDNLESLQ